MLATLSGEPFLRHRRSSTSTSSETIRRSPPSKKYLGLTTVSIMSNMYGRSHLSADASKKNTRTYTCRQSLHPHRSISVLLTLHKYLRQRDQNNNEMIRVCLVRFLATPMANLLSSHVFAVFATTDYLRAWTRCFRFSWRLHPRIL